MRFRVVTPPDVVVSRAQMKAHLSVDHTDDDAMIGALTAGAQAGFEDAEVGFLGRPVAYQKIEMEAQRCECLPLRLYGPIDIESEDGVQIVYRDTDGDDVTIGDATYRIDRANTFSPRLVALSGWPSGYDIRIQCWVGLQDDDPRIGNFQSAMKLEVEKIYDGADKAEALDAAIRALLSPYRVLAV